MNILHPSSESVKVAIRLRNVPTWKRDRNDNVRPDTSLARTTRPPGSLTPLPDLSNTKNEKKGYYDYSIVCNAGERDAAGVCSSVTISDPNGRKEQKDFSYDCVFPIDDGQEAVYNRMVRPMISRCLEGYNGCIFAYGQTASGKTYTMEGAKTKDLKDKGVIFRVAEQIVSHFKQHSDVEFSVTGSYLEIYQESLRDLMTDDDDTELKIRMNPNSVTGKDLYIEGLRERLLVTEADYIRMINSGTRKRAVAETNMNQVSSRSHAVLTLIIKQYEKVSSNSQQACGGMKRSKIHLIDLAGSERANMTGAVGQRFKEGSAINQSLTSLGNVINALSNNASYVPYRDSKLTYLLSDSLGGNSLTLVLACVTPIANAYEETISTLRFAERAKRVKNKARINIDPNLLRYTLLMQDLENGS